MAVKSNNGILTDSDEANRFNVEKGICGEDGTVSFESVEHPGMFLQAISKKIKLQRFTSIKSKDTACFYPRQDKYFAVSFSFGKIKKLLYINGLSAFRILTWNFRFLNGPTFVQTITIQNEFFLQDYTAYESFVLPNYFVRHKSYKLVLNKDDESRSFGKDASWKIG